MKTFRKTLRALRRRLRLTQAEAAGQIGVAPNTVTRWENGVLHPLPPMQAHALRVLAEYRRKSNARRTRAHSSTASRSRAWSTPRAAEGGCRRNPDG